MSLCNICKNIYSNKYNLLRHQETTCKKIKKEVIHQCDKCNKILSSKQSLSLHLNNCKKNNNIEDINKKIEEMSNKIKTLQNNPVQQTITINNNTDNSTKTLNQTHNYSSILSLSKEVIKETFDKNYTLEDFFGSQKALADFTNKHFLRGKDNPLYLCTDKSRQKFVYTDEQQQETEDINAEIMIKLMSKGFIKMKQLYDKEATILERRLKQFLDSDDNTNIIETQSQIKTLEDTYKQLLTIFKNGDKYRIQLSKILPSNVETRIMNDQHVKMLSSDNEVDYEAELEKLNHKKEVKENMTMKESKPLEEPKYDKTARHIGGITYGGLRMYKDHYVKTGKKIYHPKHIGYPEFMKKFDEFCENDE